MPRTTSPVPTIPIAPPLPPTPPEPPSLASIQGALTNLRTSPPNTSSTTVVSLDSDDLLRTMTALRPPRDRSNVNVTVRPLVSISSRNDSIHQVVSNGWGVEVARQRAEQEELRQRKEDAIKGVNIAKKRISETNSIAELEEEVNEGREQTSATGLTERVYNIKTLILLLDDELLPSGLKQADIEALRVAKVKHLRSSGNNAPEGNLTAAGASSSHPYPHSSFGYTSLPPQINANISNPGVNRQELLNEVSTIKSSLLEELSKIKKSLEEDHKKVKESKEESNSFQSANHQQENDRDSKNEKKLRNSKKKTKLLSKELKEIKEQIQNLLTQQKENDESRKSEQGNCDEGKKINIDLITVKTIEEAKKTTQEWIKNYFQQNPNQELEKKLKNELNSLISSQSVAQYAQKLANYTKQIQGKSENIAPVETQKDEKIFKLENHLEKINQKLNDWWILIGISSLIFLASWIFSKLGKTFQNKKTKR